MSKTYIETSKLRQQIRLPKTQSFLNRVSRSKLFSKAEKVEKSNKTEQLRLSRTFSSEKEQSRKTSGRVEES